MDFHTILTALASFFPSLLISYLQAKSLIKINNLTSFILKDFLIIIAIIAIIIMMKIKFYLSIIRGKKRMFSALIA